MAIPSTPRNFYTQQGNQQVLVSWDISTGATSYNVQRSTDGITYASVSTPSTTSYLDTAVTIGTQYYYKVASVNASGTSPYTTPQSIVPTPTGEASLGELRLSAQQRADRVNSNFVTTPEWNSYINQAMYELYDMLITVYEDYFKAEPASFTTDGSTYMYPLPNGTLSFTNNANASFVARPLYKLLGVDLALNGVNNAYVTVHKYNFINRNEFVFPNSSSSVYGVFNLRYRMMGQKIEFIPTPAAGQVIRLQYIPRIAKLLADTDLTTTGISDWNEYIIVKAAILALSKEESDISALSAQLALQIDRIMSSAIDRDAGQPDTISDIRRGGWDGGWGATGGGRGGW